MEARLSKFRMSHVKNLLSVALADEKFHKEELKFIYQWGERYDLIPDQMDQILKEVDGYHPIIPNSADQRLGQLLDLTRIMLIDGSVDSREFEFCEKVASGYGYHKEIIKLLLDYSKSGKNGPEYWALFKDEAKKFLK